MKFHMYADLEHRWLKVSKALLKELKIDDKISTYSYMKGDNAYLEKDEDASLFCAAMEKNKKTIEIVKHHTDNQRKIRNYTIYQSGIKITCKHCGTQTTNTETKLCDSCWELETRIERNPTEALKIVSDILTPNEEQMEKFGNEIIKLLNLKVKANKRVDTVGDFGDKTPIGLGRTIIRLLNESK